MTALSTIRSRSPPRHRAKALRVDAHRTYDSLMLGGGSRRWRVAAAVLAVGLVPTTAQARRVVYLNADPTVLVDTNGQDPRTNSFSSAGFTAGQISGWPGLTALQKELLIFYIKEASAPFDIAFTWERPASGDYDMLVMGTAADSEALFPESACSGARSLLDCEDAQGTNVSFLFHGCLPEDQQADLRRVAHTSLRALAFGWGQENVSATGQIMGGYSGTALKFGNECTALSNTSQCFHEGCPTGQQNSTADLLVHIGARVDDGPPVVEITSPAHLSVVSPDFAVEATIEDLFGGLDVTLELVEVEQTLSDLEPPYRWNLSSVPDGTWTLRVTAVDADGNVESDEVVVCIGTDVCEPGPGPDSDSGGSAGGATEGETEGDASMSGGGGGIDPTLPSGSGGASPAGSACHCSSSRDATSWGAALWLVVLARRRRPAPSPTRGG